MCASVVSHRLRLSQALDGLERFMQEAADRTEAQKRRLREMQAELSAEANTKMDEIHVINEAIGTKMACPVLIFHVCAFSFVAILNSASIQYEYLYWTVL